MPKALVDRIIVDSDGLEYRLSQGEAVPDIPADLADQLAAQLYIKRSEHQPEVQSAPRSPRSKKGSE